MWSNHAQSVQSKAQLDGLPKPSDVIATFAKLANPNLESGGGYKGTTLLWWKWLAIADVVDFLVPDGLVDILPGSYGTHGADGTFQPKYKDHLLAFAQGEVSLGYIPMLDGHIWDSLFRVLVALAIGILLGVPLGIYMGVSRFFKSFFDPLIELYRPVPPLAWAPLILTIFGIQDDGKIFLLFMVAFAIMVISARTGASGTQLSKIRASHSLGATNRQILRNVFAKCSARNSDRCAYCHWCLLGYIGCRRNASRYNRYWLYRKCGENRIRL